MFAMSRFDPTKEDQKGLKMNTSEMRRSTLGTKGVKRKRHNNDIVEEKEEGDDDDSSSSSSDSLGDESSYEDPVEDKMALNQPTQDEPTLKVIAPEHIYENEWKTQRRNTTVEGWMILTTKEN